MDDSVTEKYWYSNRSFTLEQYVHHYHVKIYEKYIVHHFILLEALAVPYLHNFLKLLGWDQELLRVRQHRKCRGKMSTVPNINFTIKALAFSVNQVLLPHDKDLILLTSISTVYQSRI